MKIYKKRIENFFIGVKDGVTLDDSWKEANSIQQKSIKKTWDESFQAGNIGTRWDMFIPEEVVEKEDEFAEFYAIDKIAKSMRCAIEEKKMSVYALSKMSGVQEIQISRFLKAENDLSLDAFTRIINVLNKGFVAGDLIDIEET